MDEQKVLMFTRVRVYDEKLRGGARRFLELYDYLKTKVDTTLCTVDSPDKYITRGIPDRPYPNTVFDFRKPMKLLLGYIGMQKRSTEIKKKKYDRIIIFGIPSAIVLCMAGVSGYYLFLRDDLIGYRKVSMNYQNKKLSLATKVYLEILSMAEEICLKKSKIVIVQCEHDLVELLKRHKRLGERLRSKTVIQINNVNPKWIRDNVKAESLCLDTTQAYKVGFIGNFDNEQKGNYLFLEAASMIGNRDIQFFIAGTGKNLEEYERRYSGEHITFIGWVNNACSFIKSCDLLVVPSLMDSCPNTVMESLYCGVPVIGSSAGGIPDIIGNEEYLFQHDVQSVVDKILMMCDAKKLATTRIEQANRRSELEFDWCKRIAEICEIKGCRTQK